MKLGRYVDVTQNDDGSYTVLTPSGEQKLLTKQEFANAKTAAILGSIERQCKTYRFVIEKEIKTLQEWANQYNKNPLLVHSRIFKLGWHITEALLTPPGEKRIRLVNVQETKSELSEAESNITAVGKTKRRGRPKGSRNKATVSGKAYLISGDLKIDVALYQKWLAHPMVFRQEQDWGYAAYLPSNLKEPVVDSIMPSFEGFHWNCYNGAEGEYKKEVAAKVLSIVDYLC